MATDVGHGAIVLKIDGSVRFLSSKIDPAVFHRLVTPNGGEAACDF
jgi:hypothetical protein